MALVLRNKAMAPWRGLEDIEHDLERFFGSWPVVGKNTDWMPAMDIREVENAYILTADLPGLKKEDIDISVKDNVITVRGERKREEGKTEGCFTRYERSYGSFERSFTVRDGFDAETIKAQYTDGVLTVTMPKLETHKPRQIEIKVS